MAAVNFVLSDMKLRSGHRTPDRREGHNSGNSWQDMNENSNNANKVRSAEKLNAENMAGRKGISVDWPNVFIGMFGHFSYEL